MARLYLGHKIIALKNCALTKIVSLLIAIANLKKCYRRKSTKILDKNIIIFKLC